MTTDTSPIVPAGVNLGQYSHVFAFFNSPEEECRTLLPFMKHGIAQGEQALQIVGLALRDARLGRLHPMVIPGGQLHENPYFALPAEFLREHHLRNGRQQGKQVQ